MIITSVLLGSCQPTDSDVQTSQFCQANIVKSCDKTRICRHREDILHTIDYWQTLADNWQTVFADNGMFDLPIVCLRSATEAVLQIAER